MGFSQGTRDLFAGGHSSNVSAQDDRRVGEPHCPPLQKISCYPRESHLLQERLYPREHVAQTVVMMVDWEFGQRAA